MKCEGKSAYRTRAEAYAYMTRYHHRGRACKQYIYECPFCHAYHLSTKAMKWKSSRRSERLHGKFYEEYKNL